MGYTSWYGRTYEEWVSEKALRIHNYLIYAYQKKMPIDIQYLTLHVYRERLTGVGKWKWKPVKEAFTDFKPSPFMKNFTAFLIERLKTEGYVDERNMVIIVPTLELIKDICTFKPDPNQASTLCL